MDFRNKAIFQIRTKAFLLAAMTMLVGTGWVAADQPVRDVTYFLERMQTPDEMPELEESHTAMASTWDRTGGNMDGADFKRIENGHNILLEAKGPGCIHRIFVGTLLSEMADTRIQIFIDHSDKAVFDMPISQFFDDNKGPFSYPLVFFKSYPGVLFPIPFEKHILVRLENSRVGTPEWKETMWSNFWQVTYTLYPSSTKVKSLSWPLNADERKEVEKTCDVWRIAESQPPAKPAQWSVDKTIELETGKDAKIVLDGCGVIRQMRLSVEPATPEVLRSLRMQMIWDGSGVPSVDVPAGYFFGNAEFGFGKQLTSKAAVLERRPTGQPTSYSSNFNSLLLGVTSTEAYSRFPMPFSKNAVLRFENTGNVAISRLRVQLDVEKRDSLPDNWGRFHAVYTEERAATEDSLRTGPQNIPVKLILDRCGRGKYVGVMLFVDWPSDTWWGEGDWQIWADEEGWPPSYHGTGSEEYFNSGWCQFDRKAISGFVAVQPGHPAVYSFHLNDAFQFQTHIKVVEEQMGFERGDDILKQTHPRWGSTAFWYQMISNEPLPTSHRQETKGEEKDGVSRLVGTDAGSKQTLFDGGKTAYQIIVGKEASETEIWAAGQLAQTLKQISGADFPIVSDANQLTAPAIVIGCNSYTRRLLPEQAAPMAAADESFVIRSKGPHIFIWGGKNRGTMYGVFAFLEDQLGCRWYSSKVKKIPTRESFAFSKLDIKESPAVRFRCVDYFDAYNAEIAIPLKINSQRFVRSQQPGGFERFWFEHSFDVFVPVGEFFDAHPEYFSLRDGKRVKDRSQLCLTNPEVLKITIERLRKFIKANPDYRVYNVAQNDNQNPCLCEKCQAIVNKEQSESGLILWFVNQVADAVKDEFPDKYIGTFAYQYTRKPPQFIRPNANVLIVLCSIECDFSHPFSHPHNQAFIDDLNNWSAMTRNIFIWDYVVNFRHYLIPHPNFGVLKDNIQILKDHGVMGILEQANGQAGVSEFPELRAYLLGKLLWNPDLDVRKMIEEFIAGYYGKSAPYVLQYVDLVQGLVTPDSYIGYAAKLDNPVFTNEFFEQAEAVLSKAYAAAENEEIKSRVERVQLAVIYRNLVSDYPRAAKNGDWEKFQTIVAREGNFQTSESTDAQEFMKLLNEENKRK